MFLSGEATVKVCPEPAVCASAQEAVFSYYIHTLFPVFEKKKQFLVSWGEKKVKKIFPWIIPWTGVSAIEHSHFLSMFTCKLPHTFWRKKEGRFELTNNQMLFNWSFTFFWKGTDLNNDFQRKAQMTFKRWLFLI